MFLIIERLDNLGRTIEHNAMHIDQEKFNESCCAFIYSDDKLTRAVIYEGRLVDYQAISREHQP